MKKNPEVGWGYNSDLKINRRNHEDIKTIEKKRGNSKF